MRKNGFWVSNDPPPRAVRPWSDEVVDPMRLLALLLDSIPTQRHPADRPSAPLTPEECRVADQHLKGQGGPIRFSTIVQNARDLDERS